MAAGSESAKMASESAKKASEITQKPKDSSSFNEEFVNFLGGPVTASRHGLGDISSGWLYISSQEELNKALDCELEPEYAAGIRVDGLEMLGGFTGIIGRVSRAKPTVLELCVEVVDFEPFPDGLYTREVADHHSCFEYGIGLPGQFGYNYMGCTDGSIVSHGELRSKDDLPKTNSQYVVYKLWRRLP